MMKRALILLLVCSTLTCWPGMARAQRFAFRTVDILHLAQTIAREARATNRLPAAYQIPMAQGGSMVITAANAFELLVRLTTAWSGAKGSPLPVEIPLELDNLQGPSIDAQLEPRGSGLTVTVPTSDIGQYSSALLMMAEAPGRKLPRDMQFGKTASTAYRLTAAQILVAMAVLFDEAASKRAFPAEISVPLVFSPASWTDISNPVPVMAPSTLTEAQVRLQILVSGRDVTDVRALAPEKVRNSPALCGLLLFDIAVHGPVEQIVMLANGAEVARLKSAETIAYDLDSALLPDGLNTITVQAIDGKGEATSYLFPVKVQNGRDAGFTPMETEPLDP